MVEIDRNASLNDLERFRGREILKASKLNKGVIAINRMLRALNGPSQISGKPEPIVERRFKLSENGAKGDYLLCHPWIQNSFDTTALVPVAKPWDLRQTEWESLNYDGKTYTFTAADPDADPPTPLIRTATDSDDNTEDQVIIPAYATDAIIVARRNIMGGTGLTITGENGTVTTVIWEAYAAGRAWAENA